MHALRLNQWKSEPVLEQVPDPEPGAGQVLALAEAGHIRPAIERVKLSEAPGAYQRMRDGQLIGRAVIVP